MVRSQNAGYARRLLDTAEGLHGIYRDCHLSGSPILKLHVEHQFIAGLHHTHHVDENGIPFGVAIGIGQGGPDDLGGAAMTSSASTDFRGNQISKTDSTTIKAMIGVFKLVP